MRVLVVGASGVVGRQLVPQLVAAGHEVVATTSGVRLPEPSPSVRWRHLDLLDATEVGRILRAEGSDVVVHQATALKGLGNRVRRFDAAFARTNELRVTGTRNLIRSAGAVGSPRLIAQSFCGWPWAPVGGGLKVESDPLDAEPPRAFRRTLRAIVALEDLVCAYPGGVVLRYGGLYGPGTSLGVGGAQIEALRKGLLPMVGAGQGVWSFVHVADAASAVVAALDRGAGVYNIVDDEPAPVATWLPELARLAGARPPRRVPLWLGRLVGGEGLVRLMNQVRGSSNARARRELGWAPRYPSWRAGLADELAVYRQPGPRRPHPSPAG